MILLNKDEYQSLADILKKKNTFKRPDIAPILGTLLHPFTKNVVQVFVDEFGTEKINFILLKMPVVSEVVEFANKNHVGDKDLGSSSMSTKTISDHKFVDFCCMVWCYDCGKLSSDHKLLNFVRKESKFFKITEELFNTLNESIKDFEPTFPYEQMKINISVLWNGNINKPTHIDYYFDTITLDAFEDVVKQYYSERRYKDLEFSLFSGLNWAAYCKSTNNLAGWVTLSYTGSIAAIYVLDGHRGKGLGVNLVSHLVKRSYQFGIIPHGFSTLNPDSYLEKLGFKRYTDNILV